WRLIAQLLRASRHEDGQKQKKLTEAPAPADHFHCHWRAPSVGLAIDVVTLAAIGCAFADPAACSVATNVGAASPATCNISVATRVFVVGNSALVLYAAITIFCFRIARLS